MESDLKGKIAVHISQIRRVLLRLLERIPEAFEKYSTYESTFKNSRDAISLINGCIEEKVSKLLNLIRS